MKKQFEICGFRVNLKITKRTAPEPKTSKGWEPVLGGKSVLAGRIYEYRVQRRER